jgi:hypothetical protein
VPNGYSDELPPRSPAISSNPVSTQTPPRSFNLGLDDPSFPAIIFSPDAESRCLCVQLVSCQQQSIPTIAVLVVS